ncbi:BgTH12-06354 [Blumeria graminis f. sp. triticale]|uniref:Bgt-4783 n=3 Tax=Blumeria graminis TaxID=34373 RepID=A0A061HHQ9_BLUGR|nr:hypothetical protein BGT96224_4783 [Blumeria graminis f. sp. tritici 96224]CAD6500645.1 BgTH12-06354 [Blumeria graminis f. sp. triticale]VCU40922.1 Bgt-4783 [Blumeria graminis f. sp. tritici]
MLFELFFSAVLLGSFVTSRSCNGYAELCSRKYSNVTQIGSHNPAFSGHQPRHTQLLSVKEQLNHGTRFLQVPVHVKDDRLHMCQSSCKLEDAGKLMGLLDDIKEFMEENFNEIITLFLGNMNRAPAEMFRKDLAASGLAEHAFIPPKRLAVDEWPTLEELIKSDTRLIVFMDHGANATEAPQILDEYSYFFETKSDVVDSNFSSCALDQPSGSDGNGLMMLVNHYLSIDVRGALVPNRGAAPRTNAPTGKGSIGAQSNVCRNEWGRSPTLISIDYVGMGDSMTAQSILNGF